MLTPIRSSKFKKDIKKLQKRGKDMEKLKKAILYLINEQALPPTYRNHILSGDWSGYYDLHLEPDWLLLYKITDMELLLARTGSHSDIFK
ncbi:type II toxin-antitoxin system mRNA interferase toxin, RelE/StbE family [Zymomonas mobilis]|uniref:Addiction module toxin, RelE/StbE family n=1 Tax=Zymomonas mobilis subsp. mobilis (strain ATCC 31821 / ZM4 / CP4) TaxID=264203 RepID=A0A806D8N5_ZYMMO|nr:type II toxin-antitoxin system mRNA interferase toxin, RelE/StbE family [Zymomonas mobilis]ADC33780.1 addiction module toxin, RelE/StbE family [Zymomonas mobilis subsp. mobilis ZM4 = ATCC 31821]AHB11052.1 addiction module toxin component, YafQ family/addiction module toxin, RelE/StbE family [Zymomonas mobilis subsp. mobilis str. CP4 = NRRL B-14023]